jgi:hypothetical protein
MIEALLLDTLEHHDRTAGRNPVGSAYARSHLDV